MADEEKRWVWTRKNLIIIALALLIIIYLIFSLLDGYESRVSILENQTSSIIDYIGTGATHVASWLQCTSCVKDQQLSPVFYKDYVFYGNINFSNISVSKINEIDLTTPWVSLGNISINSTGNLSFYQINSSGDQWCNSTNCYSLSDFLAGMNFANITLNNQTFIANITANNTLFCNGTICFTFSDFNTTNMTQWLEALNKLNISYQEAFLYYNDTLVLGNAGVCPVGNYSFGVYLNGTPKCRNDLQGSGGIDTLAANYSAGLLNFIKDANFSEINITNNLTIGIGGTPSYLKFGYGENSILGAEGNGITLGGIGGGTELFFNVGMITDSQVSAWVGEYTAPYKHGAIGVTGIDFISGHDITNYLELTMENESGFLTVYRGNLSLIIQGGYLNFTSNLTNGSLVVTWNDFYNWSHLSLGGTTNMSYRTVDNFTGILKPSDWNATNMTYRTVDNFSGLLPASIYNNTNFTLNALNQGNQTYDLLSDNATKWGIINALNANWSNNGFNPNAYINATNINVSGYANFGDDVNITGNLNVTGNATIGNAYLGMYPFGNTLMQLSHYLMMGSGQYALVQSDVGATYLGAASGQTIILSVGNNNVGTFTPTSSNFSGDVGIKKGLNITGNLNVTGNAIIGNAYIGISRAYGGGYAEFSHSAMSAAGQFGVMQQSTGNLFLNAPTGQTMYFGINNAYTAYLTATGFNVSATNGINSTKVNSVIYSLNQTINWTITSSGMRENYGNNQNFSTNNTAICWNC